MKFSKNWLQKWVDIPADINELASQLTGLGLEVDDIIDEHILDVAVPPNRGDCLSIIGIARELAALNSKKITDLKVDLVSTKEENSVGVTVTDTQACPRYIGRVIHDVNIAARTPDWMKEILTQAGMKSISPIVDITNYVMLELGQPLHAFDLDQVYGSIHVRKAKKNESLVLLDGKQISLTTKDLVIADSKQVLALAGIMGGELSGITAKTKNIFLECAYFEPVGIRLSSREKNIHTDSSHRFERIVSPDLQAQAMERATQLLLEIVGGKVYPVVVNEDFKYLPQSKTVKLRKNRIKAVLGVSPEKREIENILTRLGMNFNYIDAEWHVKVPLARQDISIEADLIEEVIRFFGLSNVPEVMPQLEVGFKKRKEGLCSKNHMKFCLMHRGYSEVITYSFIEPELSKMFSKEVSHLELINPISTELSVMRPSLLPGLVKTLLHNQKRQHERVKIFETGLRFINDDNIIFSKKTHQKKTLAGLCAGKAFSDQWSMKSRDVDFFDIKGDVEEILKLTTLKDINFISTNNQILHPGQSAMIYSGDKLLGMIGMLHPQITNKLELLSPVYVFELDFISLAEGGNVPKFTELSKFPIIKRDLNFVISDEVKSNQIEEVVNKQTIEMLQSFNIIDIYQGKGIESGKKSITISLLLQHPSRTLIDSEVNEVIDKVISSLENKFQATLRE